MLSDQTPKVGHELRHVTDAGVSLQALMALLGHASAEMSLRYGRLFDTTVKHEYERALDLAKQQNRTPAAGRVNLALTDITGGRDWKDTPLLKSRMGGGSASAHQPKAPAATPTSASIAPATVPNPARCPSSPHNASTPKPSPETPNNEAGSPKPTDTNNSSPDSTS